MKIAIVVERDFPLKALPFKEWPAEAQELARGLSPLDISKIVREKEMHGIVAARHLLVDLMEAQRNFEAELRKELGLNK